MKRYIAVFIACFALAVPVVAFGQTGVGVGINLTEQSATPATPEVPLVTLFVDDTSTPILKMVDDAGTVTSITAGSGDNTLDLAYDQGGQGAGKKIEVDSGAIELEVDDGSNNPALHIDADDSTNDPTALLIENAADAANAISIDIDAQTTGRDIEGSGATWYVTGGGVASFTGLTTLSFTPAGLTSTGTVTLDDGTTDSPDFVMTDETNESATFTKVDGSHLTMTITAADAFQVLTGNFRVGNASPDETHNGEDMFIEGILEVDGEATFDGTVECDGALNVTGATGFSENVTFTMAADEYMLLDATTTDMTGTQGALDINLGTVTNGVEGINIDVDVGDTQAGSEVITGILIDLDDDTSSQTSTIRGVSVVSSDVSGEGSTSVVGFYASGNDIEMQLVPGAAATALDINAATTTSTEGAIDIDVTSGVSLASGINVKITHDAGGAGTDIIAGIEIEVVSNAATAEDETYGLLVNVTDATDSGTLTGINIQGAGLDIGIQVDHGGMWVGTGGTADQTQGDDTLYVEGTIEVDGDLFADGNITGDGATEMVGVRADTVDAGAGPDAVTAAMSGTVFFNSEAVEFDLPADPTGLIYTFIVDNGSALTIDPNGADRIWGATDTNGDSIASSTVGDTITLRGTDADSWFVVGVYPAASDWVEE